MVVALGTAVFPVGTPNDNSQIFTNIIKYSQLGSVTGMPLGSLGKSSLLDRKKHGSLAADNSSLAGRNELR